ncbi:TadE/TadG family type IV pilus assembly protein [Candidatus Omnitrophota bacterium]
MKPSGIYTFWHHFRKDSAGGQIATWVTLIIICIFLFVMVTVNVGRIANRKTMTANAADGASMKLASYLGSYANMLSQKYVEGREEYCQRNYQNLYIVITIIIIVLSWGSAYGIGTMLNAGGLSSVVAVAALGLTAYNTYQRVAVIPGEIQHALQRQFDRMTFEGSLTEQTIMYALNNSVDDPTEVVDVHDYDEDMDTTDTISAFSYWYMERVRALADNNVATPGVRQAIANFLPLMEDFANAAEDFRTTFTEDATRPLIVEPCDCPDDDPVCDCSEEPLVVLEYAEIDGAFTVLLRELDDLGQTFTFWIRDADTIDNSDQVDDFSSDLYSFYDTFFNAQIGLTNATFDEIVDTRQAWIPLLHDPTGTNTATWHSIFQTHINNIPTWQAELQLMIPTLDPALGQRVTEAINNPLTPEIDSLEEFRNLMLLFNQDIVDFYNATREPEPLIEQEATYSWNDSLGWHHVRVEVSEFQLPRIHVDRESKWYGYKICIQLQPPTGTVWTSVQRYDQSSPISYLSRQREFWRSRYVADRGVRDAPDEAQNIDPADPDAALAHGIYSYSRVRWYYNLLPEVVNVQ